MDINGLMKQDEKKKSVPINQSGIQISKNDSSEQLKKVMTIPQMNLPPEMMNQPKMSGNLGKEEEKKFLDDNNSEISEIPLEDNKSLIGEGLDLLKEFDKDDLKKMEKEIDLDKLDLDEESFDEKEKIGQKTDVNHRIVKEKEREFDDRQSLVSFMSNPVVVSRTRLARYSKYPDMVAKDALKAGDILNNQTSKVVKKGAFSAQMIQTGQQFMNKVDKWAGISDKPDNKEKQFNKKNGISSTVDCLYVDGVPIKQFVAKQYGYTGSRNKETERAVLGAYAAMIASRQNHPITLVRPVVSNGVADVEIRNVGIDLSRRGQRQSRNQTINAYNYAFKGEEYRKYCEMAYRSQYRAKAGEALREIEGKEIQGLKKLSQLNDRLSQAGKGKHQDYDNFVNAFHRYFDAVSYIGLDPDNTGVALEDLQKLYSLNELAGQAANSYLKGKKMNLARHQAVKDIRELLSVQSGIIWGVLRSGSLEDEDATIPLKDLLDKEEEGFVVYGIEQETEENKEKQSLNVNDKNTYENLEKNIEITNRQKTLMRMKKAIDKDKDALMAYKRLKSAVDKGDVPDEILKNYALAYLKAASNALLNNENYTQKLQNKYSEAQTREELLWSTAKGQISQAYEWEFNNIPALGQAMKMWTEQVAQERARQKSYKENKLGNAVSKEDYMRYGGASKSFYVTNKEADEIVKNSKGFLCAVEVQDNKNYKLIKPSLPEFTEVETEKDGKKVKEKIPLRKTMNLMFKTMVNLTMNPDGTIKEDIEKYNNIAITELMDSLFRDLRPGKKKSDTYVTCYNFMVEKFQPAMEEMLKAEYRNKGMGKSDAEYKANNDSIEACENFFKLLEVNTDTFAISPDVALHTFRWTTIVMRNLNRDEFINSPEVKGIRINGEAPTEQEIREVLDDFYKEMETGEAELKKIRDMDPDSIQTPCFNSCVDNTSYQGNLIKVHGKLLNRNGLEYKMTGKLKTDPMKVADYLLENLDKMCDCYQETQEDRARYRKKVEDAKAEYQKNGKLSMAKMDDLKSVYTTFAKYETHQAPFVSKEGNDIITVETYGKNPTQLIQSPFTLDPCIGRYRSDKKGKIDPESEKMSHEGFNKYYDKDDYFDTISSKKEILKTIIREKLYRTATRKADHESDQA